MAMAREAPPSGDRPLNQAHHEWLSMVQPIQLSMNTDISHNSGNFPNRQAITVGISELELSRDQKIISLLKSSLIHVPMGANDSSKNDQTNTENLDNSNMQSLDIRTSSF